MSPLLNASVVASFADGSMALVSPEDCDELAAKRWRRDPYGYVVRSGGQRGRTNFYLGRDVADRMGLPPGRVAFRDGDQLNCTRENILLTGPGQRGATGQRASHTSQPRGLHRQRLRRLGPSRARPKGQRSVVACVPPSAYLLKWHAVECVLSADGSSCGISQQVDGCELVGVAVRKTRVTEPGTYPRARGGHIWPGGWEFTDLTGTTYPTASYEEGCRWVLAGRDLIHRYPPALNQAPMIALMYRLEGP